MENKRTTHFGYQEVDWQDKAALVKNVFDSVANNYDLMNDVMSLGIHRLWKHATILASGVRKGHHVLDLASGTGDLASAVAKRVGKEGHVVLCDINETMLSRGRDRLLDEGHLDNVSYVVADAELLPFPDNAFDCMTIAFGLRNVTDKSRALRAMSRIIKPGGTCLILEFSHPENPVVKQIYDLYSFTLLPTMGEWIANDRESYQYLAESIRRHPDKETLKNMILDAGFDECEIQTFTGGITALHIAHKY